MVTRFDPSAHPAFLTALRDAVLARQGTIVGEEIQFCCPAHEDTHPSARFHPDKGVWHCYACDRNGHDGGALALAGLLGVPTPDATGPTVAVPASHATIVTTHRYPYYALADDGTWHILATVWRQDFSDGKKKIWQAPGSAQSGSVKGLELPLYNLQALHQFADDIVWFVEGEKCVQALSEHDLLATTMAGGASRWHPRHAHTLAGRTVYILPDHDTPGHQLAQHVAQDCLRHGCRVKLLTLPGLRDKEDIYDWFAAGHTAIELLALAERTPFLPPPPRAVWSLSDLLHHPPPAPPSLVGSGLLFPGSFMLLAGQPGYGKSWVALDLALAATLGQPWLDHPALTIPRPLRVGLVSMEMPAHFLAQRFTALLDQRGILHPAQLTTPGPWLMPIPPGSHVRLDADGPATLRQFIDEHQLELLLLDPFSRFHLSDENDAEAIGTILGEIDTLRTTTDCAIVLVHHSRKPGPQARGDDELFAVRGSSRLLSDPQTIFLLTKIKQQPTLKLVKSNFAPPLDPIPLNRLDHGGFVAGTLAPTTTSRNRDWILDHLDAAPPDGLTLAALAKLDHAPAKTTLYRLLKCLVNDDLIEERPVPGGRSTSFHPKNMERSMERQSGFGKSPF